MATFDLVVSTGASLHPLGEPTEFVSSYTATIRCTDDETGEVRKVGKLTALRVHAGLAHNAGEPLFEVCDAHSSELNYLHALLYEPDRFSFKDDVMRRFDAIEPDLLVLDYVVLNPKWRKLKLGLLAVRRFVDLVGGGCGLAVSLIAPVKRRAHGYVGVPPAWLPRVRGQGERKAARVKLRGYFRQMGFERLGRTGYYALPLNQVTPTATELLGGEPPGA